MKDAIERVMEFMTKHGHDVEPLMLDERKTIRGHEIMMAHVANGMNQLDASLSYGEDVLEKRVKLIIEEVRELMEALAKVDEIEILDACADICYVTIGLATMVAGPERFTDIWEAVCDHNMTKEVGENFKVQNPDGTKPEIPELEGHGPGE